MTVCVYVSGSNEIAGNLSRSNGRLIDKTAIREAVDDVFEQQKQIWGHCGAQGPVKLRTSDRL